MPAINLSRRQHLKSMMAAVFSPAAGPLHALSASAPALSVPPGHERRIKWWREAKFGMFIHFGLYSLLCRDAWAMGDEDIPIEDYEQLAAQFQPQPGAARAWASLARESGMKYMVMTAKHHEGFCLFASKLTDYCAPKRGPGRDLVREYVEATREAGLRVGLYYSLMDWHHPDWRRVQRDEAARRRFLEYTHGQIRELLTQYGRIDILWYDMPISLDAAGWESEKMNRMVFELQPEILVNNRNLLAGDFSTPEQNTQAARGDWESCMTTNDCWGYVTNDHNWKSANRLVQNLVECCRDGGNYLLNIGPKGDGSVPPAPAAILGEIGQWLRKNGEAIYATDRCRFLHGDICGFTRKGQTLYVHVYYWPGDTLTIGGVATKVQSARLLASGETVAFHQKGRQLIFTGLPPQAPDSPITVIAVECATVPVQHALSCVVDLT